MRYIYEMTDSFCKKEYTRFFMPGHKGKTGYPRDLTEVDTLDDLACPSGAILSANRRIARLYNMDRATMATCGSTGCIHAMLLCARGRVLMARDAHKSAINALYLYNIPCELAEDGSTQGLISAIERTQAGTLYLTYPDYYGDGADMEAVVEAARKKQMLIIADCAHGAHFFADSRLPDLPRADMLCVSVHKTMGALTGGAAVMAREEYAQELFDNLFRVHTTSPSYVIMESIDDAYDFMEANPQLTDKWIKECIRVRSRLTEHFYLRENHDLTRIVLSCDGYTGYELFNVFKEKGILAEMADLVNIVFLTSPYDIESIGRLTEVVPQKRQPLGYDLQVPVGKKHRDIFYVKGKAHKKVHYKEGEGLVSCKPIGAYPPGTAAVMPGEIITREVTEYMERILSYGGKLFSAEEGMIQVLDE